MKITIKAILVEISEDLIKEIDKLMTVFSSAVRFAFNRIIEDLKIGDIEKIIAYKYKLNIRKAKDAVENSRQTIISQKQLIKQNYEAYTTKVTAIEKILNDKSKHFSVQKRKSLFSKLEKRKRKQQYLKKYIESNTIPPVIFGTKAMFIKRCKGLITHDEWVNLRTNRVYSRGDKTKCGNPNLRVIIKSGMSFLEISTLDKTVTNRAIKILVPIYLPQKLSKKTGKVNGINYRELFLKHLSTGDAYQVEMIRSKGKYYCHITFDLPKQELIYTGHINIIGIDTNPNGLALTMIDNKGNYKKHTYLKQHELLYARNNRRKNLCGELVSEAIKIAKQNECGIAIEDLKFNDDRDVNSKFSRIKHQFVYSKLLTMLESACSKDGIEVIKVKPQYTSKIGLYKYCHQYGMDVHNGAAMVIARRSYKYKEKVPKIIKHNLIEDINEFNKKSEWSKWSYINKIIKRKVGENPGLWLRSRKEILGIG
jgi:IS605 OrfB family transposase